MDKRAKISSPLTNEELTKRFKNQFDLVNYAIRLAENKIRTGQDSRSGLEVNNRAMQVIEDIMAGNDFLDKNLESKESDTQEASSQSSFIFKEDLQPTPIYETERKEERREE